MALLNEHSARLRDARGFDHITRALSEDGVSFIVGWHGDKSTGVSVRFDRERFTPGQARRWLREHEMVPTFFERAKKPDGEAVNDGEEGLEKGFSGSGMGIPGGEGSQRGETMRKWRDQMGSVDQWATDELRKGGGPSPVSKSGCLTGEEMTEVLRMRLRARARVFAQLSKGTMDQSVAPYDSILSSGPLPPGASPPRRDLTPDQYASRVADEAVEDLTWASESHIKAMRAQGGVQGYRDFVYATVHGAIGEYLNNPAV